MNSPSDPVLPPAPARLPDSRWAISVLVTGALGVLMFFGRGPRVSGFVNEGAKNRWPANAAIVLSLQMGSHGVGTLQDGSPNFDVVAQQAASLWNGYLGSNVRFVTVTGPSSPGADADGLYSVYFADTFFGQSFGDALAITGLSSNGTALGEVDTAFNNAYDWDSYRGPLQRTPGAATLYDARRVAIHEFGHMLGLDHPDQATPAQSVAAIMNSRVSNVDIMQADDINGIMSIYGAPTPTPSQIPTQTPVAFNAGDQLLTGAIGHVYSSPGDRVGAGAEAMLDPANGYATVHYRRSPESGTGRTVHQFIFDRNGGILSGQWIFAISTPAGQSQLTNGTFTATSTGHGALSSYDLVVSRQGIVSSLATAQIIIQGATYTGANLVSLAADLRLTQSATAAPLFLAAQLRFSTPTVPLPGARIVNLSTRVNVGVDAAQAIAGFVFRDATGVGKQALIRLLGPSIGLAGVPGTLSDPLVRLNNASSTLIAMNDDWANPGFLPSPQSPIFSLGLEPAGRTESILLNRFGSGAYTAVASGYDNGGGPDTGVALIEMYDLEIGSDASPINVSTRGQVGTGSNVMIAGFVIQGPGTKKVIVRAIGPSLTARGVAGALQDPTVTIVNVSGTQIGTNDNWQTDPNSALVVGRGLAPANPAESAIYLVLNPGVYTAIVSGVGNTTGVALVEVYDAD